MRRLRTSRVLGPLGAAVLGLAACAAPGARAPDAQPSLIMPRPCRELAAEADAAVRASLASDGDAPKCCPAGYAWRGAAMSDCPPWACCPIWEGMGAPPPMPDAPGVITVP